MTRIEFVKLNRPERARVLCELAEEFSLAGQRVLVMVQDDNQGVTLDRFMWTWKKGAFLPHVYQNGSVECHDEPVVIVTGEENPNGAQVLLMGAPCSMEFIRHFRHVALRFAGPRCCIEDALTRASAGPIAHRPPERWLPG